MRINGISSNEQSFGYSTVLSRLYKKGKLPTVKYGLYGNKLTAKTCSNEHLIPVSLGGRTVLNNIALCDKTANSVRGNKDIQEFLTVDMIKEHLSQYMDVIVKKGKEVIFDGNEYIKNIIPTFQKLGFKF